MVKSFIGSCAFPFNETLANMFTQEQNIAVSLVQVPNTALCHWKVLDPVTVFYQNQFCGLGITQMLHYTFS